MSELQFEGKTHYDDKEHINWLCKWSLTRQCHQPLCHPMCCPIRCDSNSYRWSKIPVLQPLPRCVLGGRCLSAFLIAANMQQKPRMIKLVQLFLHNVFKWRKLNTLVEPRPFCLREVWWTQHKKHPRHQVWPGFVSVTIDLFLYIVSLALRCIVEGWHTCTLDCN